MENFGLRKLIEKDTKKQIEKEVPEIAEEVVQAETQFSAKLYKEFTLTGTETIGTATKVVVGTREITLSTGDFMLWIDEDTPANSGMYYVKSSGVNVKLD